MDFYLTSTRWTTIFRIASVCATFAIAGLGAAQLPALGTETLVNVSSGQNEAEGSVAMDAAGNYAIAYTRYDGTNNGIGVQRYLRNGATSGTLILPNATAAAVQQDASIAMANDGRFVVVWEDNAVRGGNNYDVKFALYSANGTSVASGTVNATATGVRENARVAMNRNTGEFVVVFAGGVSQLNVDAFYRRFNALGVPLDTTDKQVNTAGPGRTSLPSVALAANGNFIVAWEGDVSGDDFWEAYFQRYTFGTTSATAQGANTVATVAGHDTTNVDIACDESGNFVLAWVDGLAFTSSETHDLLYRVYNNAGVAAAAPQILKAAASSGNGDTNIARIRIAMEDDQDFVATYLNNDEIYARFVSAGGVLQGTEIHVNTTSNTTPGEFQTKPWVAINPNGNRALIVWSGTGATDANGVYLQRYATPNAAPGLAAIGNKATPELQELSFTASATETAANFGDSISYSLTGTPPAGASINAVTGAFTWTPTEIQGPGSYPITVQAQDNGEPAMSDTETVTITVAEANEAPTDITLSNNTVASQAAVGTIIGVFSSIDSDLPAQPLTYSLVAGAGDTDNASFSITGHDLKVAIPPDISSTTVMSIRVQAADTFSGTFQMQFTINVEPAASVGQWLLY